MIDQRFLTCIPNILYSREGRDDKSSISPSHIWYLAVPVSQNGYFHIEPYDYSHPYRMKQTTIPNIPLSHIIRHPIPCRQKAATDLSTYDCLMPGIILIWTHICFILHTAYDTLYS